LLSLLLNLNLLIPIFLRPKTGLEAPSVPTIDDPEPGVVRILDPDLSLRQFIVGKGIFIVIGNLPQIGFEINLIILFLLVSLDIHEIELDNDFFAFLSLEI